MGYIDLSKRRVSKEDIERCTEKYSKAKAVNSIVRHVAEILGFKSNDELEALTRRLPGTLSPSLRSKEQPMTISSRLLQTQSFLRILVLMRRPSKFSWRTFKES